MKVLMKTLVLAFLLGFVGTPSLVRSDIVRHNGYSVDFNSDRTCCLDWVQVQDKAANDFLQSQIGKKLFDRSRESLNIRKLVNNTPFLFESMAIPILFYYGVVEKTENPFIFYVWATNRPFLFMDTNLKILPKDIHGNEVVFLMDNYRIGNVIQFICSEN